MRCMHASNTHGKFFFNYRAVMYISLIRLYMHTAPASVYQAQKPSGRRAPSAPPVPAPLTPAPSPRWRASAGTCSGTASLSCWLHHIRSRPRISRIDLFKLPLCLLVRHHFQPSPGAKWQAPPPPPPVPAAKPASCSGTPNRVISIPEPVASQIPKTPPTPPHAVAELLAPTSPKEILIGMHVCMSLHV